MTDDDEHLAARSLCRDVAGTCLWRCAGWTVEFLNRDEIAARFPTGVSEFIGGGWLRLAPGEVTDDTQQALILAESLTKTAWIWIGWPPG